MPTWTDIEDYIVGQLIGAANLNTFVGNLNWLAQPPLAYYQRGTTDGNYTTTAVDNLVPIDPINMALTVTTTGGILMALLNVSVIESSGNIFPAFGYDVDNKLIYRYGASGSGRIAGVSLGAAGAETTVTLLMPLFGLSPGLHTIQPMWAIDVAGTAEIVDDFAPFFGIWEL